MRRTSPSGYTPPLGQRVPPLKAACGVDDRQVTLLELKTAVQMLSPQPFDPSADAALRRAAVLILFVCQGGQWHLLFTRRAAAVQHHRGQVSFPGGGAEAEDISLIETALRETEEEIGVHREAVEIWGLMDDMVTISRFVVTPVIGCLKNLPEKFNLSPDEVDRVFFIPLTWLANPEHWEERPYDRGAGALEQVVFFHPYDGEILWGITARLTVDLLEKLGKILNSESGE